MFSPNQPNATRPRRSRLALVGSRPTITPPRWPCSQPIMSLQIAQHFKRPWPWPRKQRRRRASLSPSVSNRPGRVRVLVISSRVSRSIFGIEATRVPFIGFGASARNRTPIWLNRFCEKESFDWDDIGSWRAVSNYFKNDELRNAANCAITAVDSTNNIVFDQNGTTIALLGVHNLIVVRTSDAVLVCHRHQAEKIKNLIGKLPAELQ